MKKLLKIKMTLLLLMTGLSTISMAAESDFKSCYCQVAEDSSDNVYNYRLIGLTQDLELTTLAEGGASYDVIIESVSTGISRATGMCDRALEPLQETGTCPKPKLNTPEKKLKVCVSTATYLSTINKKDSALFDCMKKYRKKISSLECVEIAQKMGRSKAKDFAINSCLNWYDIN